MGITNTCSHIHDYFTSLIHFMTWWGVNFHEHWLAKLYAVAKIIIEPLIFGSCLIVDVKWSDESDSQIVQSYAGVVPDCNGEEATEPKGESLHLPVDLRSNCPDLWVVTERMRARSFPHRVSELSLWEEVRGSDVPKELWLWPRPLCVESWMNRTRWRVLEALAKTGLSKTIIIIIYKIE